MQVLVSELVNYERTPSLLTHLRWLGKPQWIIHEYGMVCMGPETFPYVRLADVL